MLGALSLMSNILYGKPVAESLYLELARELKVYNLTPHLVNVGLQNNQQWLQYTTSIYRIATEHDITVDNIFLPEDVSEQEFYDKVSKLSDDRTVDAIMVQQPLPARYNNSLILSAINVNKDADCLCDVSLARLYRGESVFTPATPTAVICLLDYYNIDVFGKNITVIGRGNAVGKPLSLMLTARNATVTLCHSKTENLLTHTANADIIICATGKN
ncbi:MAG: tetrahydrofolate dehydrogenase/cyclohydrolase catalytic domain-containing protein, partial [Clostridia bacterium]